MSDWKDFQATVEWIARRGSPPVRAVSAGRDLWALLGISDGHDAGPRVALVGDVDLRASLSRFVDVHDMPQGFSAAWMALVRPTHCIFQVSALRRWPWRASFTSDGRLGGEIREAIDEVRRAGAEMFVVVDDDKDPWLNVGVAEYLPNVRSRRYLESTEMPDVVLREAFAYASRAHESTEEGGVK